MRSLDLGSPDLGGAAMSSTKALRRSKAPGQASGGDALVFIAMALVSAALGLGLYAHVGVQFPIALLSALGLFITTSFIHVFVRRMQGVDLLDRRVTALESSVTQLQETEAQPNQTAEHLRPANDLEDASRHIQDNPQPLPEPVESEAPAHETFAQSPAAATYAEAPVSGFGGPAVDVPEQAPAYTIPRDAGAIFGTGQPIAASGETSPALDSAPPDRAEPRSIDGLVRQLERDLHGKSDAGFGGVGDAAPFGQRAELPAVSSPATAEPDMRYGDKGSSFDAPAVQPEPQGQRGDAGETPLISMPTETAELQAQPPLLDPVGQAIRSAADRGIVDIYLQPILSIDDRKVRYFEVLGRIQGHGNQIIAAEEHTDLSRSIGALALLDRAILVRSARLLRKLAERRQAQPLFCNISRESLGDPNFMREFVEFMGGFRDIAPYLIFEMEQTALTSVDATMKSSIHALTSMGFRLSIDQVRNVEHSLTLGKEFDFSFLKLPLGTFLAGQDQSDARARALAIHAAARDNGLTLIVDQIERKDQLAAVVSAGANLGQGYLFSEPKPLLPQVAAEVADATAAA
ncbi:MAG: EAL domain-containing protein [Hyphomicrobiaceae bacterium]